MKFVTLDSLVEAGSVQLGRGKIISKKDLSNNPGSYPVYSSAKMNDGKFGEYGLYMFDEELITWSVDGGGNLFYRPKHKFSVTNVGGTIRILDNSLLDYKYLYYVLVFLHSKINFDWVKKAHPSVIRKIYKDIPLMSIDEQKCIVTILDQAFADIDKARALTEQNLKNARELFESYLQQVFSQRGGEIENVELGEVVDTLTDYHANGSYKLLKQHVDLKEQEDFAWMVRSTDFEKKFKNDKRYITEHAYNYLTKSKLFGGEIIMSKIGNAGKVYFMPETDRPCSLAMNLFLIRLDSSKANNEYIYRYLNSSSGKAQIAPRLKGAATQTITKESVRSLQIPMPTLEGQQKTIERLKELEQEIESLESVYMSKLASIDGLKKALLQKAFSGELTKDNQEAA